MRRRDAFDRLDSAGIVAYRGWLYSEDEHGNRIPTTPVTFEGMHVHPSRHYAPIHEGDLTDRELALAVRTSATTYREKLTPLEEMVLFHQCKLPRWKTEKRWISQGDLADWLNGGGATLLTNEGKRYVDREGMPTVTLVCIEIDEFAQWEPLDMEGIAERAGVSVYAVRRAVTSANRKRGR